MSSQIFAFENLLAPVGVEEMRAKLSEGGCQSSACGSSARPDDMAADVWEKVKDHPCYSEEAHHYFARMQLLQSQV